jgi:hypothetical protein
MTPIEPGVGRVCSQCNEWKSAEFFRFARQGKANLHSICRPCGAKAQREKYRADPEPHRAAARAWHANHPAKAKIRRRSWNLMTKYGMTVEQFDAMLLAQGSACAACGTRDHNGVNWHVDHSHDTGVVRGILCHPCNTALGLLNEDADRMLALAAYALARVDVLAPEP